MMVVGLMELDFGVWFCCRQEGKKEGRKEGRKKKRELSRLCGLSQFGGSLQTGD
jgi:hypothetical protein